MDKIENKNTVEKSEALDVLQGAGVEQSNVVTEAMNETAEAAAEVMGDVSEVAQARAGENKAAQVKDRRVAHKQKIEAHIQQMSSENLCHEIEKKYQQELNSLEKQVKKMSSWFGKMDAQKMTEIMKKMRAIRQKITDLAEMALDALQTVYRNLVFAK